MENQRLLFSFDKEESQLLKGCAILMVILGHLNYFIWGGAGGVALFLLMSGYGINTAYEQYGLAGYWRKRIRKVWLPYFIVGLFDVVALNIREADHILCTLIGLDFGRIADGTMWYISYIMLWYLMYYLSVLPAVKRKRSTRRFICAIGMVAGMFLMRYLSKTGFWNVWRGAKVYIIFFPLGFLLSWLRDLRVKDSLWKMVWLVFLFISSVYLFRIYGNMYTTKMALSMSVLAISVIKIVPLDGRIKRALLFFGEYSYPLYLFEGMFLRVRLDWFIRAEAQVFIDLIFFAVTIAAAVIFKTAYECFEKMLPR